MQKGITFLREKKRVTTLNVVCFECLKSNMFPCIGILCKHIYIYLIINYQLTIAEKHFMLFDFPRESTVDQGQFEFELD